MSLRHRQKNGPITTHPDYEIDDINKLVGERNEQPIDEKSKKMAQPESDSPSLQVKRKTDFPSLEDYEMQDEEMNLLDDHEYEAKKESIYTNNRAIFLLQSTLLGLSYAMIWPTVWTYIRDEFSLKIHYAQLFYGVTYVAYPIASMISAHAVEKVQISTKSMILILNLFEIVGSLVYTLSYSPVLPLIGRFISGLGDAFYVVLMKDMRNKYGNALNERMTIECLAAFIIGVIIAPGVNIISTHMHFTLGTWVLNDNNYPGLTMAVLFLLMEVIILFFLKDDACDMEGSATITKTESRFVDAGNVIRHSTYKTLLITTSSFFYTYIVAAFELSIPLILYEVIQTNSVGAMLLYAVIGTLYAMLLMMTMTVSFDHQLETFLGVSLVAQVAGLFALIYFQGMYSPTVSSIICMILIVLCLTTMWSNDDVLYINYVQTFIPPNAREDTHNLRKFVSKFAFGIAGFTVPFWFSKAVYFVSPILIFLVAILFVVFVVIRISEKYRKV